ncbi:MFS transporter [Halococcus salifodinae]|uniref:Major facilitator superfamily protein n=1 Tax=Halococcus salifodinae DSM 8989 TaxID=1227456 RepID=M0N6B6_9EURY|nr:MFS transporter [Halococcus salifodinae]EMA52235.1 major facilitator superfamily protein [Halococcus salifodinae DSM 8989]
MDVAGTIRHEASALWADGKGKALVTIALGWGLLNGTRMIYPVLLPAISTEYDLTLTAAGFLVTLIWVSYAIGQVPGGVLADRYGERTVLLASVAIVAVALLVVVFAPTVELLFVGTALVGLGLSLYPVARITVLSELYPDRIGRALGVTMATGDTGQTLLPLAAGVLVVGAWQVGLAFVVPLLGVVALLLARTSLPATTHERSNDDLSFQRLRYVLGELRHPTLLTMGVLLFVYIGVLQTFSAFYPTYLISVKGFSPAAASGLFSVFFAVGIVAKPLAGVAYDAIGIRRSLPIVLGGAVVGFALLPVLDGFWPLALDTVLISTMLGSGAITQSYLSETIPPAIEGTGLGAIRSGASLLGSTGPVLFGAVAERGLFDTGYLLLAVLMGLVTLLTLRLPRDRAVDTT